MAQETIHRHVGGTKAQVHFHHDGCHLGPKYHLRHLMTLRQLKAPKQKLCDLDMCI
jgi:hypothetical protein